MLEQYHRILITGGSGFIGRHMVNILLSLKKQVIVLDQQIDTSLGLQDIEFIQADICNYQHLHEIVKEVDLVFHLAGNSNGSLSINDPRFDFEINALGTLNMLEATLRAGAKRFIYISSASVYGKPQTYPISEEHPTKPFIPYGASKLTGELYCLSFFHSYHLPVAIARPFCVYGPGENPKIALVEVTRYLRWHINRLPIQVIGSVDAKTRDFIHVSDLIQGLLLIADRAEAGETYNVGTGTETSMRNLTKMIGHVTGRSEVVHEIANVTDDSYRLVANIDKLKSLDFAPKVSLVEGINQLVAELMDNPELPGIQTIFHKGQLAEK